MTIFKHPAFKQIGTVAAVAALLSACSGGGGTALIAEGGGTGGSPTPTPTPTTAACALRDRQDWVAGQLREWYLFPETLPATLDPSPYPSVDAYVDALTATARAQNRDRYFTYVTSIAEENAFYASGSSAGFGFRLALDSAGRLFITESFEGTPALAAGIDRGAQIVAIGTSGANMRTVASIMASEGSAGLNNALGPSTVGDTRILRITDATGTRDVTLAKTEYELTPVSSRYGAKIIDDGGRRVGYINLRTFITTADPALRTAFANFRAQGISDFVIDLRYNGGGLVSTAELMSNLLGGGRTGSEVQSYVTFRASKSVENDVSYFAPQPQSVTPVKIAFIGTGSTASASEYVINTFIPYLHANAALIGSNTYGKPVGQIALDRAACDDRLRVVAFALENAAHQGAYFNGLASTVEASCQAADDISKALGDPAEASVRSALDYLAGRSCTPIGASASAGQRSQSASTARELLTPEQPTTAQRETPGLF